MAEEVEKVAKPGIVYLSRIPPSMNPLKVKNLLSQFGEISRTFLQPEEEFVRKRRKKHGGNTKKQFTEGWLEFKDKKIAKTVARSLNNTKIGGKKRYYYHDDIWNIKYLPKFQWTHIKEKLAYEKAARGQRMRTEISQAKKEASFYLENVGKGKAMTAMQERREKKRKRKLGGETASSETQKNEEEADVPPEKLRKKFYQKEMVGSSKVKEGANKSQLSSALLSEIFTSG